ncbi:hypothetical protein KY358_06735 [Candidatus Woesearchaeota archaeon]|nr:hypothetical protein [Candidatus Woesearchaeota archaeon]
MTEDIEKDLLDNFKDFLNSADDELEKKRYNPAVSSYFKAIAILCDLKIYQERKLLPKNHQERFLFLQMHLPDAHRILSPLFDEYRNSYNLRMKQEDALKLKENAEKLKKILGLV